MKPESFGSVIWVVPDSNGGIQSYSKMLWPAVREACKVRGIPCEEPIYVSGGGRNALHRVISRIKPKNGGRRSTVFRPLPDHEFTGDEAAVPPMKRQAPSVIHIQHEYGLFGRKIPPFYQFGNWLKRLRRIAPGTLILATAHTVLEPEYRYPVEGRGAQKWVRSLVNRLALPWLQKVWTSGTWGALDGVIVHSSKQLETVRKSGCENVRLIPHFVPKSAFGPGAIRVSRTPPAPLSKLPKDAQVVMIFGFISPEKGQDIAIRAMAHVSPAAILLIAGGVRRPEDRAYADSCRKLAQDPSVAGRVIFTDGFVPEDQIDAFYGRATLVLAPFRETSGSGSLAYGFSRGAAILTSDLPLNRELVERVPYSLDFFSAGDPVDCAARIEALLVDEKHREALKAGARAYAAKYSIAAVAAAHAEWYGELLKKGATTPR